MSYVRTRSRRALGQFPPGIVGPWSPDLPGFVPGPGSPMMPEGIPGPTMPASLFPTSVKWGDVVSVGGPFAGKHQGQIIVRFAGVPGQAVYLTGPFGGSVVVPEGAQSGACTIEVDGRTVYGGSCVVSSGISGPHPPARAPEHAAAPAWKNFGEGTSLGDTMSYVNDGTEYTRGAGAVAADIRRGNDGRTPIVRPPNGRSKVVGPGVRVVTSPELAAARRRTRGRQRIGPLMVHALGLDQYGVEPSLSSYGGATTQARFFGIKVAPPPPPPASAGIAGSRIAEGGGITVMNPAVTSYGSGLSVMTPGVPGIVGPSRAPAGMPWGKIALIGGAVLLGYHLLRGRRRA